MHESTLSPLDRQPCRFVFLHGAGTGPWIWEEVRKRLDGPSTALAVPCDLPGMDPERCAAALLADPSFPADGPVVLVLHSLAGVLEVPLVRALGSRAVHVVHVAAVVPRPGRSFASTVGFPANLVLPILFRLNPRGLKPSPAMLLRELGEDLSEELRAALVERHRPVRGGLFLEPAPSAEVRVPRTYLLCVRDRCVSPALQSRLAQRLGARVRPIAAGHLPMLSRPGMVAEALAGLVGAGAREAPLRFALQAG